MAMSDRYRWHRAAELARRAHQLPAAGDDTQPPAALSRLGMLDVPSSTPPRASGRKHRRPPRLTPLASKPGELCGLALTALLVAGLCWACSAAPAARGGAVRVVGSDTMLALNRRLAQEFMRVRPGAAVLVEGGGSGVGVTALVAGEAEICAASRPLRSQEVSRLYASHGTLGVRYLVAQDALSVYLNPGNPVRDLSIEQLRGLFSGELRSWSSATSRHLRSKHCGRELLIEWSTIT